MKCNHWAEHITHSMTQLLLPFGLASSEQFVSHSLTEIELLILKGILIWTTPLKSQSFLFQLKDVSV